MTPTWSGLHFVAPDPGAREAIRLALPDLPGLGVGDLDSPPDTAPIRVEPDPSCVECFALSVTPAGMTLRGGVPLGLAHGVAEALERAGYGLQHPLAAPSAPATQFSLAAAEVTRTEPAIALRGLHLHTLHPIEALDAYWITGETQLERARRINRWSAWNGANFVEWVALDDIQRRPEAHAAWVAHTRQVIDDAHARGLKVGLAIQLFGASNLQRAFDLVDDVGGGTGSRAFQIGAALDLITPPSGVAFDVYNLSFGEFSGVEPAIFVESVDATWAALHARAPEARMVTTIHVGNREAQRVTWEGQEMLYYFLAQFADPAVVPWIHTVMFYNLYDPAGGAYDHAFFDEHRAFTEARLADDRPVGYFPETAYWIAFDNSVPQFLPVYVTSRLLDLDRLRPRGALAAHVLFSSGWEWGYWMHDRAALRASYRGETTPEALFTEAYADPVAGAAMAALGEAQREALILKKAAPYTAGRDIYIDAGDLGDLIAAPDRRSFDEVAALDRAGRDAFQTDVLTPLRALQNATAKALRDTGVCPEASDDDPVALAYCRETPDPRPVFAELADGLAIDWHRLRFVQATYRAALGHAEGGDPALEVALADAALEAAQAIVAARHAARWDQSPWLTERFGNPTVYGYGYLHHTNEVCHWRRERNQLRRLLTGAAPADPNCAL